MIRLFAFGIVRKSFGFALAVAVAGVGLPSLASVTRIVDAEKGPYLTIQAAVDAADAGDTIFVKAGLYASGGKEDTFATKMMNRVFVDKQLTLVGEDREKTIILGAHATTPVDSAGLGLGTDAYRCIGVAAENVVISNLTITGGATHVPTGNDIPTDAAAAYTRRTR